MANSIRDETQYEEALEQVYRLMQTHLEVDTLEGSQLNELVTLIERYEAIHYAMTRSKQTE